MARTVQDGVARPPRQVRGEGEIPPSTLAAQIVQSHMKHDKRSQPSDQVDFRQLLEELRTLPNVDESDVRSNYLLITVVAQAGLSIFRSSDPFNRNNVLIDDVLASLDIIELVIHQNPDVLFQEAQDNYDPESQLCLTLLPKLFAVLSCRDHNHTVRNGVARLLTSVTQLFYRYPTRWSSAATLLRLFRICVDDVLLALERPLSSSESVADLRLPSPEARSLLLSTTQTPIALREGSQIQIHSFTHGVDVIYCLVASILGVTSGGGRRKHINRSCSAWILSACGRLTRLLQSRYNGQGGLVPYIDASSDVLDLLQTQMMSFDLYEVDSIIFHKTTALFIEVLHRMLSVPLRIASQEAQEKVAANLQRLGSLIVDAPKVHHEARAFLFDSLAHIALDISDSPGYATLFTSAVETIVSEFSNPFLPTPVSSRRLRRRVTKSLTVLSNQTLIPTRAISPEAQPLQKRRRTESVPLLTELASTKPLYTLCETLDVPYLRDIGGLESTNNSTQLGNSLADAFKVSSEPIRKEALRLMISMPCIPVNGDYNLGSSTYPNRSHRIEECNCRKVPEASVPSEWTAEWQCFAELLYRIVEQTNLQDSKEQRVLLMVALGRYAAHSRKTDTLDLMDSALGKWCLQGLRSSSRELRIAAGQALPGFLHIPADVDDRIPKRNRMVALNFLRKLSELNDIRQTETLIATLGHIADVCGDEELNIILLQLVDFLGHTNPFICGLADVELRRLGGESEMGLEVLLRPYWRTIGVAVLKDLHTRPQKTQQLCDLLGWTINKLLLSTQTETLPYLILWRKQDVLERIAHARGNEATVWSICMQPRNLTAILSTLIAQHPTDVEANLAEHLALASSAFETEDIANLLRVDKIGVACEVLKAAGDVDGHVRSQVLNGFYAFTSLLSPRVPATKRVNSNNSSAGAFFDSNSLGIMASFSNVIDNPMQPWLEKRRCLRGIEVMMTAGASRVSMAIPQIKACLQSALGLSELRDDAFLTWSKLSLTHTSNEDRRDLVEQTFTIVVQNWAVFSPITQTKAYELILDLLAQNGPLIEDMAVTLPSLANIPLLAKTEAQLQKRRNAVDVRQHLLAFSERCRNESSAVVLQALRELLPYLSKHQTWIHASTVTEQPDPTIAIFTRSLLDVCARYSQEQDELSELCVRCMGIVGCLDPNRVEVVRDSAELIILSNFDTVTEAVGFVTFLLEKVLVKAFQSVTNPRAQGFLAYAMQELLKFCGFSVENTAPRQTQLDYQDDIFKRWMDMSNLARSTLTPFVSSNYTLATQAARPAPSSYPLYKHSISHSVWLRDFVFELALQGNGDNARQIFKVLSRIIKGYDMSIASFLLPYAATNIIIGGTTKESQDLILELSTILNTAASELSPTDAESLKLCSESVFSVLDYLSRWLQDKKKEFAAAQNIAIRSGKAMSELEIESSTAQIRSVEGILKAIPPEVISRRAVECGSYARALFHWEQYMREQNEEATAQRVDQESSYQRLQEIYTQIDEPDGIDGVSSFCHLLSPDQQVMEHRRAGRWVPAQSWYELQLKEEPLNMEYHLELLSCLREAGQHHMVLDHTKVLPRALVQESRILSVASEAAWNTERWDDIIPLLKDVHGGFSHAFNVGIGVALAAARSEDSAMLSRTLKDLRLTVAKSCSLQATSSLQACHEQLLKLHALYEIEVFSDMNVSKSQAPGTLSILMDRRLDVLGSCAGDKQYLLGIRRAAMQSSPHCDAAQIASSFMISAKLSRKGNQLNLAHQAVLQAAKLGDESSRVEQARLLWKEGEHKKAIQNLEGLINSGAFNADRRSTGIEANPAPNDAASVSVLSTTITSNDKQNLLAARAHLLLAKWLDMAGQSQTFTVNAQYQDAVCAYKPWEKSYYYLGRYYNKLLEISKTLPVIRQPENYLVGEVTKFVVDNYLRALLVGTKYVFETLPKFLTLWLDAGVELTRPFDSKEHSSEYRKHITDGRLAQLGIMNKQVRKYMDKIPAYVFYTALSQMISRISHPNKQVYELLADIITRVVTNHPQQALWALLATVKSSASDRAVRGTGILAKISKISSKAKSVRGENMSIDLKGLITQAQKLSDQLIRACEARVPDSRGNIHVSLSKDLGFNLKTAPCLLVVPLAKTLAASFPVAADGVRPRNHKPFPSCREAVTIASFEDDVMILGSLQRPRKLTVRGSDGNRYGLLCKPNDDLRKDQRLMEFNAVINRSLKKDAESSRRRLYIRTYAVTPLNEACGLIEWVDGLKPMRDIIVALYRQKNVNLDYVRLRGMLDEACSRPDGHTVFTNTILPMFKPVLHEWFAEIFPTPESWFAARLRYARSCAVASMVGHALGLGDRHGENLLLEEGTGGVFHVDFNCLFDKGLTFDKPELVPFRLTHNMVDAFGAYGVEGPFRRSAELAMKVMRAKEDALLTILETFVYDPTADFVGQPRKRSSLYEVPTTPREVLESVKSKVNGLLRGESVPLSVEGHVDALIRAARDPKNQMKMYIGWCAFF